MQYNHNVKTIEGTLFEALGNAGAISSLNSLEFSKNGFSRAARTDRGVHAACNVASVKMIIEDPNIRDRINECLPPDIRIWDIQRVNKSFNPRSACGSRWYEYLLPRYVLGDGDTQKELFTKCMKRYRGANNFHNFTVRKNYTESSALRYIREVIVSEQLLGPDNKQQEKWLSIKLHGDSFMLYQIRKMLALAIIATRNGKGSDLIGKYLQMRENRYVPMAPSEGLLLEHPVFDAYNRKLVSLGYESIDPNKYAQQIQEFKLGHIYPQIYTAERDTGVFHEFAEYIDTHTLDSYQTKLSEVNV